MKTNIYTELNWQTIHPEISYLIRSYLPFKDQLTTRAVCKTWNAHFFQNSNQKLTDEYNKRLKKGKKKNIQNIEVFYEKKAKEMSNKAFLAFFTAYQLGAFSLSLYSSIESTHFVPGIIFLTVTLTAVYNLPVACLNAAIRCCCSSKYDPINAFFKHKAKAEIRSLPKLPEERDIESQKSIDEDGCDDERQPLLTNTI